MNVRPLLALVPALTLGTLSVSAQTSSEQHAGHPGMDPGNADCPHAAALEGQSSPDHDVAADHAGRAGHASPRAGSPTEVGQDAFAALAEMRALLVADPSTNWERVDLDALREHLVDMDLVVLDAAVTVEPVDQGFEARVTGRGRTLEAIRRMVPAHASFVSGRDGLHVETADTEPATDPAGVVLRVTTDRADEVARLRGLGFFGFLTAGEHHRRHHLAMASGSGHP